MKIRLIKHEVVPDCGSYEVRFPDGRPSRYFYFENLASRRLRPDLVERSVAEHVAKIFARAEQRRLELNPPNAGGFSPSARIATRLRQGADFLSEGEQHPKPARSSGDGPGPDPNLPGPFSGFLLPTQCSAISIRCSPTDGNWLGPDCIQKLNQRLRGQSGHQAFPGNWEDHGKTKCRVPVRYSSRMVHTVDFPVSLRSDRIGHADDPARGDGSCRSII
jgi:hypothetical protein